MKEGEQSYVCFHSRLCVMMPAPRSRSRRNQTSTVSNYGDVDMRPYTPRCAFPFVDMKGIGSMVCDESGDPQSGQHPCILLKPEYMNSDFLTRGRVLSVRLGSQQHFEEAGIRTRNSFTRSKADPKFQQFLQFCIDEHVFTGSRDPNDIPIMVCKRSVLTKIAMTRQRAGVHYPSRNRGDRVIDNGLSLAACKVLIPNGVAVLIDYWNPTKRPFEYNPTNAEVSKLVINELRAKVDDYVRISVTSGVLNASSSAPPVWLVTSAEEIAKAVFGSESERIEIRSEILKPNGGTSESKMLNFLINCSLTGVQHLVHATCRNVNGSLQTSVRVKNVNQELTRSRILQDKYTCAMKTLHSMLEKIVTYVEQLGPEMTLLMNVPDSQTEPRFTWKAGTDLLISPDIKKQLDDIASK